MAIIKEITAPKDNADNLLLVREVFFDNNDVVEKGDNLIVLETSKTAIVLDSPCDGFIEYIVVLDQEISIGEVIIRIHDQLFDETITSFSTEVNLEDIGGKDKVISFKAEAYIKENKLDVSVIKKHFIALSDLEVKEEPLTAKSILPLSIDLDALKHREKAPINTTEVKISLAKKNEILALTGVQSSGLVSTISISVDVTTLSHDYETDLFQDSDSYLPIIIYEVSRLIKEYPLLNAYYDEDVIRLYDEINVGVAFDIDDGLKVCTIRGTDSLSMPSIEQEITQIIDDYLNRRLTHNQLTRSTFTITDLSSYGVNGVIPLVNFNQSAILGISSIDTQLNRINLSLSFDHRVTEGKVAGSFLMELKQRISSHMGLRQSEFKRTTSSLCCNNCMKTLEEDFKMRGIGLVKIVDHEENETLLCQTCLDGWS